MPTKSFLITSAFWAASAERAAKTFAQTLAVTLGAGAINILSVPWTDAVAVSAGAALLSVLTSIASGSIGAPGPSLTSEVITPPAEVPADAVDGDAADSAPAAAEGYTWEDQGR